MRTYDDFYTEMPINAQDGTKTDPITIRARVYFGIRLQTTFMSNRGFYKVLGFLTLGDLIDLYKKAPGGCPSPLKINKQADLARLGAIRELAFTIIPVDPGSTIPPFDTRTNTAVPYSVSRELSELIADMYRFKFDFGPPDDDQLEDFINLLQTKTMVVDSYSRELQSYMSLFKSLKLQLQPAQFNEVEKLLLIVTDACDVLNVQMQEVIICLQKFLPRPKNSDF